MSNKGYGDRLARGNGSALFTAGHSRIDDPIELKNVAPDGPTTDEEFTVVDKRHDYLQERPKSGKKLVPLMGRVLLKKVVDASRSTIELTDDKSYKGEVVSVGPGMIIGGTLFPIPVEVGDTVLYGEYNSEEVELDGEHFILVPAEDLRLKEVAA